MIEIKRKEDCCGCNACGDVCPKSAISFDKDCESFEYPVVNKDLCVDCHLCENVCPVVNSDRLKHNDFEKPICHAAVHKNLEIRFDSTSGGLFSAFAEVMYKQGGYVGGAIWIETDWHIEEYISNDPADLPRLRSSKYLQSLSEGFYTKIKTLLKAGEKVLVCGTPCQMAALRAFLNYNDYENLIIVDFICLGVNSPKVWRRYLDFREQQQGGKIVYVKPKNKEMGWRELTTKLVFDNGKVLYDTKETSIFTNGYIGTHAYCRPSCYECHFKGFPRMSDITIADFWGGESVVDTDLDNNIGTSLALVNSNKGAAYYELIKKKVRETEVPFDSILAGNHALMKSLSRSTIDRKQFYDDLGILDFGQMSEKYGFSLNKSFGKKQKIKNFIRFCLAVKSVSHWSIHTMWTNFRINFLDKRFDTDVFNCRYVLINRNVILDVAKTARIHVGGVFNFGSRIRFPKSHLESRLLMEPNSFLNMDGNVSICYGSDIEIFHDSELHFGGKNATNIGCTIICGNKIDIGFFVQIGRNCTIRDNNGNHYIARRGYKNSYPVEIGQHSWLCEACTIIGGAKLGDGVIVGAKSVVMSHIPSFSMVSGNPAQVVDKDIYWKY